MATRFMAVRVFSRALLVALSLSFASVAQTHLDSAARGGVTAAAVDISPGNDGSSSYSYPFRLPTATGRYQPALGLSYNSNQPGSLLAVGWSLNDEYIDQDYSGPLATNGTLQPRYYLVHNGQRRILYAMSDGSWRPAISEGYFSLSYNSAYPPSWTGTDSTGNAFLYASTEATGPGLSQRFHLSSVTDLDGNAVAYHYQRVVSWPTSGVGDLQLTEIQYGGQGGQLYSVLLSYQAMPSQSRGQLGSLDTWSQSLSAVAVRRQGADSAYHQLYSYGLQYAVSPDTGSQLLWKIWQYGQSVSAGPLGQPTWFGYQSYPNGQGATLGNFGSVLTVPSMTSPTSALLTPTSAECKKWLDAPGFISACKIADVATWIDMDGDGRPDLVWGSTESTSSLDGIRWARNRSNPQDGTLTFDPVAIISGSNGWTGILSSVHPTGETNRAKVGQVITDSMTRIVDLNGDGRMDLLTANSASCTTGIEVRFGSVDVWQNFYFASPICMDTSLIRQGWPTSLVPISETQLYGSLLDTTFDLVDVTGDGILDAVRVTPSGWNVYPGYRTATGWAFGAAITGAMSQLNYTNAIREVDTTSGSTIIDLIDLNGDGVPDRVHASNGGWQAELGLGLYSYNSNGSWLWTIKYADPTYWSQQMGLGAISGAVGVSDTGEPTTGYDALLLDVNRDGRPEYITLDSYGNLTSFLNLGNAFAAPSVGSVTIPTQLFGTVKVDTYGTVTGNNTALLDVNGDGVVDYVVWDGLHWQVSPAIQHFPASDTLFEVHTPSSADLLLSYAPSTDFGGLGLSVGGARAVLVSTVLSGPTLGTLTRQFSYSNPAVASRCDEQSPCDSLTQTESIGFTDTYEQDDATGQIHHANYNSTLILGGLPTLVEASTGFFSHFSTTFPPPSLTAITSQAMSTWGTRPLNASDCNGIAAFPLIRYQASTIRATFEGSTTLASQTTVYCPAPDGTLSSETVIPDRAAMQNAYILSFTYLGPPCVGCVVTKSVNSGALGYSHLIYDSAAHVIEARGPAETSTDKFTYESHGLLATQSRSYPQQQAATGTVNAYTMTETYARDNRTLDVSSVSKTDGTTTLVTSFTPDPNLGLMLSVSGPYLAGSQPAPTKSFQYDGFNRLIGVALQGNRQTAYSYTLAGDLLPSMNAFATYSSMTTYTFASTIGASAPVPNSDDVNASTTYYDPLGRVIETHVRLGTGAPAPAATQINQSLPNSFMIMGASAYDPGGRLIGTLDPFYYSSSADPGTANQTWREIAPSISGLHATRLGYDIRSRATCKMYSTVSNGVIAPAPSDRASCIMDSSANSYRATATTYGVGQVPSTTDNRTYFFIEAAPDWENDGSEQTATRGYFDASGRLVYSVDQYQNVQQFFVDLLGRTTGVVRYAGYPGQSTTQASEARVFDAWGNVIRDTDNCANALASPPDPACRVRLFTYLPTGELVSAMQAPTSWATGGSQGVAYSYGSLGRLTESDLVTTASGGQRYLAATGVYSYDAPNAGLSGTAGRLSAATNSSATIFLGYDPAGRQTDRVEYLQYRPSGEAERVSRSFRNDGRMLSTSVTALAAPPVTYYTRYDSAGRPTQVDDGAARRYWKIDAAAGYDALGRLPSFYEDNEVVHDSASFDPTTNLLTAYSAQASTSFVSVNAMTYAGSKLTGFTDAAAATTFSFEYDRASRLRRAKAAISGTANSLSQKFDKRFSAFLGTSKDNIATVDTGTSVASLGTLQYMSNASLTDGTIVSDKTYAYDVVNTEQARSSAYPNPSIGQEQLFYDSGTGNITTKTRANCPNSVSFTYDAQDRLTQIANTGTGELLAYDGVGALVRRVFQSDTNGNLVSGRYYIGADLTIVTSSSTSTTAQVHILLGNRIASVNSDGSVFYYHRDHLGSVIATSMQGGGSGSSYRYDPYGKMIVGGEPAAASEIGYTGGLRLSEGLVFLGARVYDPTLRRFLQPDNVDSNRYTYVRGDPANLRDPTGHFYSAGPTYCWEGICGVGVGVGMNGNFIGGIGWSTPQGSGLDISGQYHMWSGTWGIGQYVLYGGGSSLSVSGAPKGYDPSTADRFAQQQRIDDAEAKMSEAEMLTRSIANYPNGYQSSDSPMLAQSDQDDGPMYLAGSPFAFIIRLLEKGSMKAVKPISEAEAVAARRAGENVMFQTRQAASAAERAAGGGATDPIRHGGHMLENGERGYPHYQTDTVEGHSFWGGFLDLLDIVIPFPPIFLYPEQDG